MTITIAVTGKSGSGKTTFVKTIAKILHNEYPEKSILLIDNDLSRELGFLFNIEVRNTISDIIEKKYKYKTRLPDQMPKQEFIEWALQDILVKACDDIDLIVTGYVSSRECNSFTSALINDALVRLIKGYDIIIFDCEYDLEYLYGLIDYPIDVALIVTDSSITSIYSSSKIKQVSSKHTIPGQLGLILNKVKGGQVPENISRLLNEYDLDILGILPYDFELKTDNFSKDSELVVEATKQILFRLNLPHL